jgi:hypothetical protein
MWAIILLVLPLWGLEVIVVPPLVWQLGPASWHPMERVIYAACGALAAALLTLAYARGTAARRASVAGHVTWRWSPGTRAREFRQGLEQYLRGCGWQIDSIAIVGSNRLEVAARKEQWRLALLCVGPGHDMVNPSDLDRLNRLREKANATHAVIVTPDQGGPGFMPASGAAAMHMRYRELPTLETALGRRRA